MSSGVQRGRRLPPRTVSVWSWGGPSGARQGQLVEVRADLAGDRDVVAPLDAGQHLEGGWSCVSRETRDRVRAAIINSGEQWPAPVLVAVRPASAAPLSLLDAALAVAVLSAAEVLPRRRSRLAVVGELGLDGSLRVGPGHAAAVAAAAVALPAAGTRRLVVPTALVHLPAGPEEPGSPGRRAELVGVTNLTELATLLRASTPRRRPVGHRRPGQDADARVVSAG